MEKESVEELGKLPSLEQIEAIIHEVSQADFSNLSFNKLFRKIQEFQFIGFPTALIKQGHFIERCRINKTDEVFFSEKDLSYRTDFENIKKYGRANTIGNSLFYGSFESDIIKHPRLVNLMETSEIFRNLENHRDSENEFIMTVGKWRVDKDFEVAEVVFNTESIKKSPDIRRAFEHHLNILTKDYPEHKEQLARIMEFFSNEFAKTEIRDHFDYMVSALYSYMAIDLRGLKGIRYASVKTDFNGNNIAITPSFMEQFLTLEIAAMFKVSKNGMKTLVTPIAHCTDFGNLNTAFKWEQVVASDAVPVEIE